MSMAEQLITLENATKIYNGRCVIDSVSHSFCNGESIAFCGHNGCGKSTMLKLLSGLISLSGGSIHYNGRPRFSYVPERFPGMEIELIDYLHQTALMEGIDPKIADNLISDFFMDPMIHIRMDKLSKGSLQKAGVIQALMMPHDVLLLDEPLSGQDTDSQEVFISKVRELKDQGITILMSCHEKRLIDALSDKVYTIDDGKLVTSVLEGNGNYKIRIRKNDALSPRDNMKDAGRYYEMTLSEERLRETVMGLYADGWEIVGIEEYA